MDDKYIEIQTALKSLDQSYDSSIDAISFAYEKIIENSPVKPFNAENRFSCSYRLWKSVPKQGLEDHWMYPACSTNDMFLVRPMDEEYGRSDYVNKMIDFVYRVKYTNKIFDYEMIKQHEVLWQKEGSAAIVFIQANTKLNSPNGLVDNLDLDPFIRETMMIHPYYGSTSIHELFKLLLEWQWGHLHGGSQEVMGQLSNEVLSELGLSVDDQSNLVLELLSLPDQQVFQYYKSESCNVNETCPEIPQRFLFWSCSMGLLGHMGIEWKELSQLCLDYLG